MADGDRSVVDALRAALFAHEVAVSAVAALPVVELLDEIAPAPAASDRAAFLAVAAVVWELESGVRAVPRETVAGSGGSLLVPGGDGLVVVPPGAAKELLRMLLREAEGRYPTLALAGEPDGREPLAVAVVEPGSITLRAHPAGELACTRLAGVGKALLGLAVLAFLLGNALMLRVVRRELRLSRMKSEFLDLVSHELRPPLAALSVQAEMLARGDVPVGKRQHYVEGVHRAVQELAELVHRVLDLARLEKGRVPLETRSIAGRRLLANGIRGGRSALRLGGHRLELRVPRQLPAVSADGEVMARALRNLLENAAKHAPADGGVTLSAGVHAGRLEIAVADRGPGVEPADRVRLFEPFQRGVGATVTPGTGLGLALVRQAARAHGGSVGVADREGGGAVFTLSLPLPEEVSWNAS